MVDTPRTTAVLLPLVLAAALTACSSDSGRQEPGAEGGRSPSQTGVGDGFPRQDVIITATCAPGSGGNRAIRVDGRHPRSFKHVAHTEFPLPGTAVVESDRARPGTAVRNLCEPDKRPADAGDVTAIRSLFDQDFTKMAVVTQDPRTGATHVGHVDRSGKSTDPTGNEDFGETPARTTRPSHGTGARSGSPTT
jgi:hypothetical protein